MFVEKVSDIDENGDGKISPAELPVEEIEEIVANIDADGDGLVNDDLRNTLYERLHDSDFVDTKVSHLCCWFAFV
jgi:hypothetical protein